MFWDQCKLTFEAGKVEGWGLMCQGGWEGWGRFGLDLNNPDFVKYAER